MNPSENIPFETAIANAASGIGRIDRNGAWRSCNRAMGELLGLTDPDTTPEPLTHWFRGDELDVLRRSMKRLVAGERNAAVHDFELHRDDDRKVRVRLDLSVIDDADPPNWLLVMIEDTTASLQIRAQLEASEARVESVLRAMADGVVLVDADGTIRLANQRSADLLGRSRDELLGSALGELPIEFTDTEGNPLSPDRRPVAVTLATGRPQRDIAIGIRLEDGTQRWIEISAEPIAALSGADQLSAVATFSDITRRYLAERQLRDSEERLSLALEGAKLGFWDWDLLTGEFAFSDDAAQRLGYSPGDVDPSRDALLALVHPDDRQSLLDSWSAHLEGTRRDFEMDVRLRRKSGGFAWRLVRGRVVRRDEDDRPIRMAGTLMDIGERKQLEAKLHELATIDGLTGVANRRHGQERLEQAVHNAQRLEHPVGFVLLDIDHFKQVNDRFGHPVGDQVLKDVAAMLGMRARRTDVVARWGGEEFAVVLPGSDGAGARRFAETVLESMRELEPPGDEPLTASLGAAAYRPGESVTELVKRADRLMYRAKHSGRARVESDID